MSNKDQLPSDHTPVHVPTETVLISFANGGKIYIPDRGLDFIPRSITPKLVVIATLGGDRKPAFTELITTESYTNALPAMTTT